MEFQFSDSPTLKVGYFYNFESSRSADANQTFLYDGPKKKIKNSGWSENREMNIKNLEAVKLV